MMEKIKWSYAWCYLHKICEHLHNKLIGTHCICLPVSWLIFLTPYVMHPKYHSVYNHTTARTTWIHRMRRLTTFMNIMKYCDKDCKWLDEYDEKWIDKWTYIIIDANMLTWWGNKFKMRKTNDYGNGTCMDIT